MRDAVAVTSDPAGRFDLTGMPHGERRIELRRGGETVFSGIVNVIGDTEVVLALGDASTFILTLSKGWNLVSSPLALDGESRQRLKDAALEGKVWEWPVTTRGNRNVRSAETYNATTDITTRTGYWLYGLEPTQVELRGDREQDLILTLQAGWNLVGPLDDIAETALTAARGRVGPVWSWDGGRQVYTRVGDGTTLERGKGYWILADSEVEIRLGN